MAHRRRYCLKKLSLRRLLASTLLDNRLYYRIIATVCSFSERRERDKQSLRLRLKQSLRLRLKQSLRLRLKQSLRLRLKQSLRLRLKQSLRLRLKQSLTLSSLRSELHYEKTRTQFQNFLSDFTVFQI